MSTLIPFDTETLVALENDIFQHLPMIQDDLNGLVVGYKDALNRLQAAKNLTFNKLNTDLAQLEKERKADLSALEYQFNRKSFFRDFLSDYSYEFDEKSKSFSKIIASSVVVSLVIAGSLFMLKGPLFIPIAVGCLGAITAIYFVTRQTHYKQLSQTINAVLLSPQYEFTDTDINKIISKDAPLNKAYRNLYRQAAKNYEDNKKIIEDAFNQQKAVLKSDYSALLKEEDRKEKEFIVIINNQLARQMNDQKSKLARIANVLDNYPETADFGLVKIEDLNKTSKRIPLPFMRMGEGIFQFEGVEKTTFHFPYFIEFINKNNVVFSCGNVNEIKKAIDVSHNIIARTLLAVPAGKVKFTFIDPVGLGASFAPFLAMNEDIYGSKIWVETQHIDQQLHNLSLNIEHVIQKLLQDSFDDVASYNKTLQNVKEPNRVLVIYNFPQGFNEGMINRLMSIMVNGPKAGLNVILVADKTLKMPYGLDLSKIEKLDNNKLLPAWNSANSAYDTNIPFKEAVKYANDLLEKAENESLNYVDYVPSSEKWWSFSSADKAEIPIGRKRGEENLDFVFDNEHKSTALMIGKPGSGKSNLLHILITNAFIHYSPNDLEFYLIDFKGGVEFIPYADKKIPHIRTIAIESEREFGLSVIEGLEKELLRRENEFRDKKVNKISEYREKYPNNPMPRIMLVVDEFQEFFTYQDAIGTKAEAIFDRIVRKGRAFGINLILSTQSLTGNSLPRGTKDLISIRIALMCSDSDSRSILSDDNPAAKLLIRPGQGIYNTSNGLVEGNHHFQAFFLKREDHYAFLDKINGLSESKKWQPTFKQTIFRGDMTAHFENNRFLETVKSLENPKKIKLWLGESTSLDDDIYCVLTRQSGSNLICMGLDENLAIRIMASVLLSIVFHQKPQSAQFHFINALNPDSDVFGAIDEYFDALPYPVKTIKNNDILAALQVLEAEIKTRLEAETTAYPNIYLTINGLQRTRKFKTENWNLSDESKVLRYILKEGADVGVFVLIYCDTLNSLEKCIERKALGDMEHRIALQMSEGDSNALMNVGHASKLGKEKAYYYNDTEGGIKKVRPYQLPKTSWFFKKLNQISSQF
jgi:DNA segregation ATPase FtsK/SpoIIIE, S-DNA-T family